jgi:hypothetical protein
MRTIAIVLALLAPAANAALVTYEYRGAEYNYIATEQPSEDDWYVFNNPWLNAEQNYVTGWITFDDAFFGGSISNVAYEGDWDEPLECELDDSCDPTPVHSWSFFDGVTQNGSPGTGYFFNGGIIQFSTDASGNLVSWFLDFYGDPEAIIVSNHGDVRLEGQCTDDESGYLCARSSRAGTWTKVPEPGALALLAIPLCGILLARRSGQRVRQLRR